MTFRHCVAVDLGASSGRVMLARYDSEQRALSLREIHRFVNGLQNVDGFATWDIDSLESEIHLGLPGAWTMCCLMNTASASACRYRTAMGAPTA